MTECVGAVLAQLARLSIESAQFGQHREFELNNSDKLFPLNLMYFVSGGKSTRMAERR